MMHREAGRNCGTDFRLAKVNRKITTLVASEAARFLSRKSLRLGDKAPFSTQNVSNSMMRCQIYAQSLLFGKASPLSLALSNRLRLSLSVLR